MLFSVVIPTFNRGSLLREALDSVFAQNLTDYEVIVVDDGSTDSSETLCQTFGGRIRLLRQEHKGPGAARNLGAKHASGDYLAFLDSDDLWFPWTLDAYASVIHQNKRPSLISGNWITFREEPPTPAEDGVQITVFKHLLQACTGTSLPVGGTPAIAVRAEAFNRIGGFCEMPINGEDTDLWLRLGIEPGFVRIHCPPLFAQRIHTGNVTRMMDRAFAGVKYQLQQERAGAYPGKAIHQKQRLRILAASARNVTLQGLRTGDLKEAWTLYLRTLGLQLGLFRVRYALGFPPLTLTAFLRTYQDASRLSGGKSGKSRKSRCASTE